MLQLFVPQTKVQKDRRLMRETDFRMAKYSRRGMILNFFAFLMCLAAGSFYGQAQRLAIILVIGLLLVTVLRGYFLFRFDTLYAKAPSRWRNQYFVVSFIGAVWWSFILVSVTSVVGMRNETPLLWLYTVVFYSATANAFAPYRQFLASYQFIGQVPTAIAAILLGTLEGYFYGTMMMVFYLMLHHQGRNIAEAYWDRLEANYALKQKARNLEVEKRDTQAAVELNNEFMTNLGHELRTSLNDVIGALSLLADSELEQRQRELLTLAEKACGRQLDLVNNVMDFSRIATKELVLEKNVFHLRRQIEQVVDELAPQAHQKGMELFCLVDDDLPLRVRGDSVRLCQILIHLLSNTIKFTERGAIVVEAKFDRVTEFEGELRVTVHNTGQGLAVGGDQNELFNAFAKVETSSSGTGLGLAICKGLAECMEGGAGMSNEPGLGNCLWLRVKLQLTGIQAQQNNNNLKLPNCHCLLVDLPPQVREPLLPVLKTWGVISEAVNGRNKAMQKLLPQEDGAAPFDLLLLYSQLGNLKETIDLSHEIAKEQRLPMLKQVLAVSREQGASAEVQEHVQRYPQVSLLYKPVFRQNVFDLLAQLFSDSGNQPAQEKIDEHDHGQGKGRCVLLVEDHRVNQMVAEGMLKKLGYQVVLANNGCEALKILGKRRFDIVLMDCQMPEMDGFAATREIREREAGEEDTLRTPIIAMTAHAAEGDQARCLAAGMDDYLPKPVHYDQLESRLKHWLGVGAAH